MASDNAQTLEQVFGAEIRTFLTRRLGCAQTAANLAEAAIRDLAQTAEDLPPRHVRSKLYRIAEALLDAHGEKQVKPVDTISSLQRTSRLGLSAPLVERREALVGYAEKIVRNRALAEDVVQDAWFRLERAQASGLPDHPVAYLYRLVRNLAVDRRRQLQREQRLMPDVDFDQVASRADDPRSPETIVLHRDELNRLERALRELPQRTQEIFKLARIDGLTYSQTAKCLGISDSSVQKHLARATKHVMQRMRRP